MGLALLDGGFGPWWVEFSTVFAVGGSIILLVRVRGWGLTGGGVGGYRVSSTSGCGYRLSHGVLQDGTIISIHACAGRSMREPLTDKTMVRNFQYDEMG